jgi:hypothetical protein
MIEQIRNKDMRVIENLKNRTKQINLKTERIVKISNKSALIKEIMKEKNKILIKEIMR